VAAKPAKTALPTFAEAGRFATMVGVTSERGWLDFVKGLTRESLFQKVLSVVNQKIIQTPLEA
jgi:hypothetical protein